MTELLKTLILDFHELPLEVGTPRELKYELVPKKAFVCVGVRRCGKSTLLYQIIDALEREQGTRENILYVNLFDDRLTDLHREGLGPALEAYYALFPVKRGRETVHCFFDEIQMVADWEPFVDRLLRTEKCQVYLTGSSATMLAKEVATQMRGRSLAWELFPFSFREFLVHRGQKPRADTSRERAFAQHAFEEYWLTGGFPETMEVSDRVRVRIHQEYFKAILHRDIVERHDAGHPRAVLDLGHRLVNNIGSLHSLNRLTDYLKSLGHRVSKAFVGDCLQWFEDAFFLFPIPLYDSSLSRQKANPRKIYCIDHALVRSVSTGILVNSGHLLESLVFVSLRRRTDRIHYYRTRTGKEVDFVWIDAEGRRHLVQVCESLAQPSTRKRELAALQEGMAELGLSEGAIVTRSEADHLEADGKQISIQPAWRFLLD